MFETDPVCHMQVMPETAAARYDYKGTTYYFCNPRCLERFKANPEQFLGPAKLETSDSKSRISNVIYTCPMHRKSARWDLVRVQSAEWRSSRKWRSRRRRRIRNLPT